VYRAAVGDAVQFVALLIGEHALERQLDVEVVLALLLFAVVVGDFHGYAGQRDALSLRIQLQGQGLARRQGCVEIVVGRGRGVVTAQAFGQIGEQLVVIDVEAVAEVVGIQGVDGNRHGEPLKRGRKKVMQL